MARISSIQFYSLFMISIGLATVSWTKANAVFSDINNDEEARFKRSPIFGGFGGPPMPMAPHLHVAPGPPMGFAGPPPPFPPPATAVIHEPAVSVVSHSMTVATGACPGGDSLGKPCDAKRPWPQCPPQSYCYAVNSVDIGPYYCCPVWSTYGAQWRPAAPFYPYYPPMPYNWPYIIQATANWGAQTSPAAGWIGQLGPVPPGPVGPIGGAMIGPAFPDGPFPVPGPVPMPFEKDKRKKKDQFSFGQSSGNSASSS